MQKVTRVMGLVCPCAVLLGKTKGMDDIDDMMMHMQSLSTMQGFLRMCSSPTSRMADIMLDLRMCQLGVECKGDQSDGSANVLCYSEKKHNEWMTS